MTPTVARPAVPALAGQGESAAPEGEANWADQRAELGRLLGLAEPVPDAVLRRALAEQVFVYHLLASAGRPEMLERFFQAPATLAYAEPPTTAAEQAEQASGPDAGRAGQGNLDLAAAATKALARWAASGFVRADPQAYERRLAACLACDQLAEPPRSVLARIAAPGPGDLADGKVCGACGCFVTRKAGMATESCPLPDPADPARTRWGEPVRA